MWRYSLVLVGLAAMLAGCARPQKEVVLAPGDKVIEMKASSFGFDPNLIRARQGDRLILVVENVSGMRHNITLKNPAGDIVFSEDLPAHETVRTEISLPQVGEYSFYCDKPMHPALGMKGRLVAEP